MGFRIQKTEEWKSQRWQHRMVDKLFVLIPQSCRIPSSISENDPRFKGETAKEIVSTHTLAGNSKRKFTTTYYELAIEKSSVQVTPNQKTNAKKKKKKKKKTHDVSYKKDKLDIKYSSLT